MCAVEVDRQDALKKIDTILQISEMRTDPDCDTDEPTLAQYLFSFLTFLLFLGFASIVVSGIIKFFTLGTVDLSTPAIVVAFVIALFLTYRLYDEDRKGWSKARPSVGRRLDLEEQAKSALGDQAAGETGWQLLNTYQRKLMDDLGFSQYGLKEGQARFVRSILAEDPSLSVSDALRSVAEVEEDHRAWLAEQERERKEQEARERAEYEAWARTPEGRETIRHNQEMEAAARQQAAAAQSAAYDARVAANQAAASAAAQRSAAQAALETERLRSRHQAEVRAIEEEEARKRAAAYYDPMWGGDYAVDPETGRKFRMR